MLKLKVSSSIEKGKFFLKKRSLKKLKIFYSLYTFLLCIIPHNLIFAQTDTLHLEKENYNALPISDSILYISRKNSNPDTLTPKIYIGGKFFLTNDMFNSICDLSNVYFNNYSDFTDCDFKKDGLFCQSTFNSEADFTEVIFEKDANFKNCTFSKNASFRSVEFHPYTRFNFENTILPDSIVFSGISNITNEIDLTVANYRDKSHYDSATGDYKRHGIYLYKSSIAKLRFDYLHFKLIFFNPMDRKDSVYTNDEKATIYESVLKNFKDHGQMESYRKLDIEFKDFKMQNNKILRWIWWLPYIWWNYGYNKELIFPWIIGLLIIFTVINFFYLDYLNNHIYRIEGITPVPKTQFAYRFWYSFVYTSNIFFKFSLKFENLNFKRIGSVIYILIIFLLGLVCFGYLANFVLQK
jgi:hypothetical protein